MSKKGVRKAERLDELFAEIGAANITGNEIPTCVGANCPWKLFKHGIEKHGASGNEGFCKFYEPREPVTVGFSVCPKGQERG